MGRQVEAISMDMRHEAHRYSDVAAAGGVRRLPVNPSCPTPDTKVAARLPPTSLRRLQIAGARPFGYAMPCSKEHLQTDRTHIVISHRSVQRILLVEDDAVELGGYLKLFTADVIVETGALPMLIAIAGC